MSEFIRLTGPWGIVLAALIVLNLGLAAWSLASMLSSSIRLGPSLKNRINAVLFWGAFGAVLGFLGQVSGIYAALRAISTASEISPSVVMEGFAISFLTTIMGLVMFLGSSLAWLGLRGMYNRLSRAVPA
jgi:biopolymer transport protein ExbB/TolQ